MPEMKKLAVFVSGSGSNMLAIHRAIVDEKIDAEISLVISNTKKSKALEKAETRGIENLVLNPKSFDAASKYEEKLLSVLHEYQIDAIILAGYLKRIPPIVVDRYSERILNIHPSLLPAFGGHGFYGMKVHEAAIARGVKWSGVTIHLVTSEYDEGPIVLQQPVEVMDSDTPAELAARILDTEHKLFPKAVALLVENRLSISAGKVQIES